MPSTGDKVKFIINIKNWGEQNKDVKHRCSDSRSNKGKINPDRKINKNDDKGKSLDDS